MTDFGIVFHPDSPRESTTAALLHSSILAAGYSVEARALTPALSAATVLEGQLSASRCIVVILSAATTRELELAVLHLKLKTAPAKIIPARIDNQTFGPLLEAYQMIRLNPDDWSASQDEVAKLIRDGLGRNRRPDSPPPFPG